MKSIEMSRDECKMRVKQSLEHYSCAIILVILMSLISFTTVEAKTRHNKWDVKYEFKSPDCFNKLTITINGISPGTTITAEQGDTIVVEVSNSLLIENLSIHWHGIRQIRTPWFDGTEGVTHQCPISAGDTFVYKFVVDWGHNMTVVEADGHYVEPFEVKNLFIYSGETYAVLVRANQDPSRTYWVQINVVSGKPQTPSDSAIVNYFQNPPRVPTTDALWNGTVQRNKPNTEANKPDQETVLLNTPKNNGNTKLAIYNKKTLRNKLPQEFNQKLPNFSDQQLYKNRVPSNVNHTSSSRIDCHNSYTNITNMINPNTSENYLLMLFYCESCTEVCLELWGRVECVNNGIDDVVCHGIRGPELWSFNRRNLVVVLFSIWVRTDKHYVLLQDGCPDKYQLKCQKVFCFGENHLCSLATFLFCLFATLVKVIKLCFRQRDPLGRLRGDPNRVLHIIFDLFLRVGIIIEALNF